MKQPKTINICGKKYNIIYDKTYSGGSFDCSTNEIKIGTKDKHRILEIMIHEISEIILTMRGLRFCRGSYDDNGDYMFVMNHQDFENYICDLTYCIEQLNKE